MRYLAAAAVLAVVSASPAHAHREGGFFFGLNVGPGYGAPGYYPQPYYAPPPPVYYAPPPVYYPPPPVYYAPPPLYYPPPAYYPYRRW
jgi:hypothetical protein